LLAVLLIGARAAEAFVPLDVDATIEATPRWSAAAHASIDGAGLHDGMTIDPADPFADLIFGKPSTRQPSSTTRAA
jgi:hypothetical protein